MESIAKKEPQALDDGDIKAVTIVLPDRLWRRAKAAAAGTGLPLRQWVKSALEQYLGSEGKAA